MKGHVLHRGVGGGRALTDGGLLESPLEFQPKPGQRRNSYIDTKVVVLISPPFVAFRTRNCTGILMGQLSDWLRHRTSCHEP